MHTSPNGAGKSTLLNILSRHVGWDRQYVGTPVADRSTGAFKYISGLLRRIIGSTPTAPTPQAESIGSVWYGNGTKADIFVPAVVGVSYGLEIRGQQPVNGLHIPSHRTLSQYQQVSQIPSTPMSADTAFNQYKNENHTRWSGGHASLSPVYRLKEALIAMAMFGEGNSVVKPNPGILQTYHGFIDILRKVLPAEIGFESIEIRMPEVVVVTKSGSWPLDAASGGVMSIIDMAWSIYLYSRQHSSFVVTMDEPENHLHPSMQRSLLSNFTDTFPGTQFIVATHSPFIVSSMSQANVYVLRFEGLQSEVIRDEGENTLSCDRRVRSMLLGSALRAGTANEILRDVLGVSATMPLWAERSLNDIIARYRGKSFNDQMLSDLRKELSALGLGDYYSDAVSGLAGSQ